MRVNVFPMRGLDQVPSPTGVNPSGPPPAERLASLAPHRYGAHSRRLVRSSIALLALIVVGGCEAAGPSGAPPSGGPSDPHPILGDAGTCTDPDEGCPCVGEEPIECYTSPESRGGDLLCGVGTRYCRGGVWSACLDVENFDLPGAAGLIEGPVECNPCNPDCSVDRDRPDDDDLTDENSDGVEYDPSAGGITLPPSSTGGPASHDEDRDGVPDIADDCPRVPGDPAYFGCPVTSAPPGVFHELPFGGPAVFDPCEIDAQVRTADVYFLVDTTGSMGGEINNLRSTLTSGTFLPGCTGGVIGAIRCTIPDAWFGVGYHDDYRNVYPYGTSIDDVYRNRADISSSVAAAQTAVNGLTIHNGYDWPEGQTQALWAVATGGGLPGHLSSRSGCPAGRWGYPCFRPDAIPIVILFTDAPFHNGYYTSVDYEPWRLGFTPPSYTQAIDALVSRGIKLITVESSDRDFNVLQDVRSLHYATGSVNGAGVPFVFSISSSGSGLSTAIVNAVQEVANYSRLDISAVARDNPATPGFDERGLVESIVATSWGPRGACNSFSGDHFYGCLPGSDVHFEIGFRNDVVMSTATPQVFNFVIEVLYNDSTVAFTKNVRIVIPPGIPACASVSVAASRVVPNIMFLVDESGSMTTAFPGSANRWIAVRDALIGTGGASRGLIGNFETDVRFGLQTYTSSHFSSGCSGSATRGITTTDLNAFAPINTFFRSQGPGGGTPTAQALREVYDAMIASPPPDGPQILILATDGEPSGCSNTRAGVVAEVQRGFALGGIRTYAISVGTAVGMSHLEDVANAGLGIPPTRRPAAPAFVATDTAMLQSQIEGLIRGEIVCELETSGSIDRDVACFGDVRLSGRSLTCEGPNGWSWVDPTHITLNGTACTELRTDPDATVTGEFPCPPITGSYWRIHNGDDACEIPPERPLWRELYFDADIPSGTQITFQIRTANTEAELAAARTISIAVPTATSPIDLGFHLRTNGLSENFIFLQTTAILEGRVDRTAAPVLREMTTNYDCVPIE